MEKVTTSNVLNQLSKHIFNAPKYSGDDNLSTEYNETSYIDTSGITLAPFFNIKIAKDGIKFYDGTLVINTKLFPDIKCMEDAYYIMHQLYGNIRDDIKVISIDDKINKMNVVTIGFFPNLEYLLVNGENIEQIILTHTLPKLKLLEIQHKIDLNNIDSTKIPNLKDIQIAYATYDTIDLRKFVNLESIMILNSSIRSSKDILYSGRVKTIHFLDMDILFNGLSQTNMIETINFYDCKIKYFGLDKPKHVDQIVPMLIGGKLCIHEINKEKKHITLYVSITSTDCKLLDINENEITQYPGSVTAFLEAVNVLDPKRIKNKL